MKSFLICLVLTLIAYSIKDLFFASGTIIVLVGMIITVDLIKKYRKELKDETWLPW